MRKYLVLLTIAISIISNAQSNLTIKGKFLNFRESEELHYYRVYCTVYNPVYPFSDHDFVVFNNKGEFEFNYRIEFPTIAKLSFQNRSFTLAVNPDDKVDVIFDLSDATPKDNLLQRQNFIRSNYTIDSVLYELKQKYREKLTKSLSKKQIENIIDVGYSHEQKYFMLNYLAYKNAEGISSKNQKIRFLAFYDIISLIPDVFEFNKDLHDLLTKTNVDLVNNLKKTNDSIVFIYSQFESFTSMIKHIKNKHRGKIIYIDVWASWCAPCVFDLEKKKEFGLQKFFDNHDVQTVFLYKKSPQKDLMYFVNKLNMKGEHYYLPNELEKEAEEKYGIYFIPHYFLIDKKGNFVNTKNLKPWIKTKKEFVINNELLNIIEEIDKE